MGFPQTRLSLIKRLTTNGSEQDWHTFHNDYWGAVCQFATRWRGLSKEDTEDVAAEVFQAILTNRLLERWHEYRTAKLRTLICGVAKNIMSNRARVVGGRKRILQELAAQGDLPATIWQSSEPSAEQEDLFYAAWVDDLLRRSVDSLMTGLHREGKGDVFRVLHGRICEQLATREIAELLEIPVTTAENHMKAAKRQLASELEQAVRRHVEHYCEANDVEDDFNTEWSRLSDHLTQHGGLEIVLQVHFEQLSKREASARGNPKDARE